MAAPRMASFPMPIMAAPTVRLSVNDAKTSRFCWCTVCGQISMDGNNIADGDQNCGEALACGTAQECLDAFPMPHAT